MTFGAWLRAAPRDRSNTEQPGCVACPTGPVFSAADLPRIRPRRRLLHHPGCKVHDDERFAQFPCSKPVRPVAVALPASDAMRTVTLVTRLNTLLLLVALFAGVAQADTPFAISGSAGQASTLYTLDETDGSLLSTIGATGFSNLTGIAFHHSRSLRSISARRGPASHRRPSRTSAATTWAISRASRSKPIPIPCPNRLR